MPEPLVVRPGPGGRWVLHPPRDPHGDGYVVAVRVELDDDGLRADREVAFFARGEPDLAAFVDGLAAAWAGWPGERRWSSADGDLLVDAVHDGRGHVTLGATLRGPGPVGAWSARVAVEVEAGEQMRRLAADLHALLRSPPG